MSRGWDPGPKYQMYLERIRDLLDGDEKRTVRDVYYALEATGFESDLRDRSYARALERHEKRDAPHPEDLPPDEWCWQFEYRYVKRAVKKGRRHGYIDPEQIFDASRSAGATVDVGAEDAEDFVDRHVRDVWKAYDEDFWRDQDAYVEVWLEKQSLVTVFAPICEDLNVRLEATQGDWSDSKVYQATQRLLSKIEEGKDVVVLYYGDFNPSGFHAPVSIQATMTYYGLGLSFRDPDDCLPAMYFDCWPADGPVSGDGMDGSLMFDRKGINVEHIERFDLPENPNPSSTDKDETLRERFQTYVTDGRDVNVELNALKEYHRDYLEDLVRDSIEEHIDEEQRDETEDRIEEQRDLVKRAVNVDDDVLEEA